MTDQRRALLTERERDILTGEADVTDNYRYSVESRIRSRLRESLTRDVDVIREQYPEMFDDLIYPAICEPEPVEDASERPATPQEPTQDSQPVSDDPSTDDGSGDTWKEWEEESDVEAPQGELPADIEEKVREYLQGSAPKSAHGKEIAVDALKELRRNGPMQTAELQEAVYPGYEEHYAGARAMWNSIGRYLEDIPGFEKPEYGKWGYMGDSETREELKDNA